ncbi:MAG: coenzyme PQQ synthesis protein D [Betaproteobacteria bacterium]|nr:MAG: coenzyme PQQ synthesis protein D [Betaproteobacteria bacterium]
MNSPVFDTRTAPQLAPRYVFRWEPSQDAYVLLYPEGIIKLNGSAGEILKRCDGSRSEDAIVVELQQVFPDGGAAVAESTRQFLAFARGRGWLQS